MNYSFSFSFFAIQFFRTFFFILFSIGFQLLGFLPVEALAYSRSLDICNCIKQRTFDAKAFPLLNVKISRAKRTGILNIKSGGSKHIQQIMSLNSSRMHTMLSNDPKGF